MKIFVGGVNASGKSSLLHRVSESSKYPLIHAAGVLMDYLKCSHDYETLRGFSQEERNVALDAVMRKLCLNESSFLVDGHYLTLVRGKTTKVTGPWLQEFDGLILISASLDTVWKRIRIDAERDRALFSKESSESEARKIFSVYLDETEKEFFFLKNKYGLPGIHVLNDEIGFDNATMLVQKFISDLEN